MNKTMIYGMLTALFALASCMGKWKSGILV